MNKNYLQWLDETQTVWWHDSADKEELKKALANNAVGITTNPVLVSQVLESKRELLKLHEKEIQAAGNADERTELIIRVVTQELAEMLLPVYDKTGGENGYVCAQVNPNRAGDAAYMIENAKRIEQWAPNISVKLPATQAGLEAMEECIALGMNVTGTVSFTVPQAVAVAEAYEKGYKRAQKTGRIPKICNAVIMVGRLDDYIRDVAHDNGVNVAEEDIICAGTAAIKEAYEIFESEGYRALLMPAGMRGAYHAMDLAGAGMRFSIHPKIQRLLLNQDGKEEKIQMPVSKRTIEVLSKIREFTRAYEPDGMKPSEFITYGVTQKTLAQFVDAWSIIAHFPF